MKDIAKLLSSILVHNAHNQHSKRGYTEAIRSGKIWVIVNDTIDPEISYRLYCKLLC